MGLLNYFLRNPICSPNRTISNQGDEFGNDNFSHDLFL